MTTKEYNKMYRRTKHGLIMQMYSGQRTRSKSRGHKPPMYTFDEFKDWLYAQHLFHDLYDLWVLSGYDKYQAPSVDRDDSSFGYSFSNITLMTWHENNQNGYIEAKHMSHEGKHKSVSQYSLSGAFICTHPSISAASRSVGRSVSTLSCCVNGITKTSAGYKWRFH